VVSGSFELLDAPFLVPVDSSESKKEFLRSGQTADDVVRCTQAKVGVGGVRYRDMMWRAIQSKAPNPDV
jgi:hypothetical protein